MIPTEPGGELDHALALLRATLEATADGILVTAVDGRIRDCNAALLAMWQVRREQLVGRDHQQVVAELARDRVLEPESYLDLLAARHAQPPAGAVDLVRLADGRTIERLCTSQLLDGREVGRVWTYRDVTIRLRSESQLREESELLELLNSTGTAIAATLELEALLQLITDSATRLSGAEFGAFFYNTIGSDGAAFQLYTLSGAPRAAFERFGHPRATPLFGPTFNGAGSIRIDDVRADPRYGQWAPHHGMPPGHLPVCSYLAVPVRGRGGEAIGGLFFGHSRPAMFSARAERIVAGVAAQATIALDNARLYEQLRASAEQHQQLAAAERQARAEAERSSRLKDEFLATLSHELRTPLHAILGWSQVLQQAPGDPAQLAQGLEIIARNARAQTRLIEDLLDMSRIASGKVRLDVQLVDPHAVVEAALESVRPAAAARELRLRKVVDPRAGPVSGDPGRLQQVVWNLLSNAVKFTAKGGAVELQLLRSGSSVEITVSDNGPGIEPEFLPHVFDRFRQADASITRRHGGLGLGLSIVRQLVELHGGTVQARSAGCGQGASFTVRLPQAPLRPAAGADAMATAGLQPLDLGRLTVLVVDDEPDARELIKRLLEQFHATVVTAASARAGLAAVAEHRPDVIVSDVGMPEQDGYQFLRELRRRPADQGGATPALALTGFARSEDRTRAMLAGYQLHVTKPIEPHELVAAIASLAGRAGPGGPP